MPPATGSFYVDRGNGEVHWLTAAPASLAAPTVAEIDAGVDLSCEIAAFSGFAITSEKQTNPTLCTTFDSQTVASTSPEDSGLEFYKRFAQSTVFDLFAAGNTGYLVFAPESASATSPSDVWQVSVDTRSWLRDIGATQKFNVPFSVLAEPVQGTIAA